MWRTKIVLLAIVVAGVSPLSASGSADFDCSTIVDLNDLAIFTTYWLNSTTEPEDLDGSGFVDLKDFSAFGIEYKTTIDYCSDLNSIPNPYDNTNWELVVFTGIYPFCGMWDCIINDEYFSDPCWDNCGHNVIMGCEQTQEFDYYCAFNYRYGGQYGFRVGLCVYDCGINDFEIIKNRCGCRMIMARHRTRDIPPQDPYCYPNCNQACDEGTQGKYNWQIVLTDLPTFTKFGYCRESYTKPSYEWGWQSSEGEQGPCKLQWW